MTTRAALPGRLFPSRQSRRRWPLALILALASLAGCSRQSDVPFRVDNARAHLDRLTNAGPRPTGSAANAAARAYLVDQLRLYGFDVRTQTVDASRPEYGRTMRVTNIVATRAGSRQDAIALVAHYDSIPIAPGAMDDGIGTAVALEAARLLAAAPALRHTLVVLLTDGEEFGLMGAVGAMNDAELRARLKGYINLESTGSTGPAILFESGPGNEALIRAWANAAPHPHGASFALEIYKRLPNDTDFTILKEAGIPGLNMAPVGNSHAYHTSRDTADRVAADTLLHMGESVVTTMRAMDALDRLKADRDVRFASVGERTVIVLADWQGQLLTILAIVLGLIAWIRIVRHLAAGDAIIRFIATVLWGILALASAVGAMVGASWLLVASSAVHHPWYALPMRTCALIVVSGALGPWLLTRLALVAPERVRYLREPASIWALTLPIWGVIAAVFEIYAPLASPLWAVSLALAGAALAVVPPGRATWMRAASVLVLVVTTLLFLGDGLMLFEFLVAVLGRLPIVTPLWVLPGFIAFVGMMIAPPAAAALIGLVEGRRGHGSMGGGLLAAFAITLTLAYMAPAYTADRPARRSVVYVNDALTGQTWWEVAGNEPGLDLADGADQSSRWRQVDRGAPIPASVTVGRATGAFRFRRPGEATPAPARVVARIVPAADSPGQIDYEVAVTPQRDGLGATLHLPAAIVPVRAVPVGAQCLASWCATYLAIPPEGMTFKVRVPAAAAPSLASAAVTIGTSTLPGGDGRRLLPWLPQERTDWTTYAQWVVRPESAVVVPVEAVPGAPLPTPSAPPPAPAQPAPTPAAPVPARPAPPAG